MLVLLGPDVLSLSQVVDMYREDKKLTEVVEIIDSKAERARLVQRTDVLDKVKALATLPGHGVATTAQVAEFYEVEREAVKKVVQRHGDELRANGYRVIRGEELSQLRAEGHNVPLSRTNQALWDRRAVLLLGMLLRDSEVAKEVRRYLLNVEEKTHEAVVTQQVTGLRFDGLASQIAQSIEDYFGPRLAELEERLARLESAEQAPAIEPPEDTGTPLDPGSLAEVLGIPSRDGYGRPLYVGVSAKDGLPWARYGSGKRCEWLDRKRVIHAFRSIVGRK